MARASFSGHARVNAGIRPLVPADAAWVDAWIEEVARRVGYDAPRSVETLLARVAKDRRLRVRAIERDGVPVGVAVYAVRVPHRGAAIIEIIVTPPGHARRGAGMTAARLLEDEIRATGISRVYAPAPAVHGIAVYFWIRLGYRPLMRPAWPCERPGVGWMMRDLRSPENACQGRDGGAHGEGTVRKASGRRP
ncbi:MAG: GNAT family N-acetyltransferase [Dehalococcoidia bacterium]